MAEALSFPNVEVALAGLASDIDGLLAPIPTISDGTNHNTFDDVTDPHGTRLGIAKRERPDGSVGYHVGEHASADAEGYVEGWDFHWDVNGRTVTHTRTHESRLHHSSTHPDDQWKQRDITIADAQESIRTIVNKYRTYK